MKCLLTIKLDLHQNFIKNNIQQFDLRIYQQPTGYDVRQLGAQQAAGAAAAAAVFAE